MLLTFYSFLGRCVSLVLGQSRSCHPLIGCQSVHADFSAACVVSVVVWFQSRNPPGPSTAAAQTIKLIWVASALFGLFCPGSSVDGQCDQTVPITVHELQVLQLSSATLFRHGWLRAPPLARLYRLHVGLTCVIYVCLSV